MPKGYKTAKTMDKEAAREALREIVKANLPEMVSAQIENAKGLKYLVARDKKTGKFVRLTAEMAEKLGGEQDTEREVIEVWEKDPSVQAFTDLLNRTIDLPAKPVEEVKQDVKVEISWKSSE
jgi:hypothetical protein